jgi:ATP-dependent RNA helicase SUPV3L1/SUV3
LPRDAYRVLGYRQCGERAVRVDILERLADLIRPALAWRETSPGEKPAGAFDGRSFVVTQAMTSLTGSAGEDFASILRALGYRMDRRPPLPPKPAMTETVTASEGAPAAATVTSEAAASSIVETTPGETLVAAGVAPTADITPQPVLPVQEAASSATLLPQVDFANASHSAQAVSETAPVSLDATPQTEESAESGAPSASSEAPAEPVAPSATFAAMGEAPVAPSAAEATSVEAAPQAAVPSEAASEVTSTSDAAPAEPQLIEVWRPGGRSDERRPRHDRRSHRRHEGPSEATTQAATGEAAPGQVKDGEKRERHRHGRRDRHRDARKTRPDQAAEGATASQDAPAREQREDRGGRPRDRFEGKGREETGKGKFRDREEGREGARERGRDRKGRDRDKGRESGPSHRPYATSAAPRDRDRPADPNSPFAKLAALKEQLSAGRKE